MEKMVLEGQKQLIWGMCVFMYPQGDWRKPRRKSGSERTSGPSEGHPVALLPPQSGFPGHDWGGWTFPTAAFSD